MNEYKETQGRPKVSEGAVAVPVEWALSEPVQTLYANQLYITHHGNEFYLVFGELAPECGPGTVPDSVWVRPVVRLAVSPKNMLRMAEVISDNVVKYRGAQLGEGGEAE